MPPRIEPQNEPMKSTLIVVADLACLKAYTLEDNHFNRTPRLELLEHFTSADAHGKLVEKVSDSAGRFPRATGASNNPGIMSDGERHNIELERRKRLVRQLANRLNTLGRNQAVERVLLAASKEINHQLLDGLDAQVRDKVYKNLPLDLTKLERGEILGHFSAP